MVEKSPKPPHVGMKVDNLLIPVPITLFWRLNVCDEFSTANSQVGPALEDEVSECINTSSVAFPLSFWFDIPQDTFKIYVCLEGGTPQSRTAEQ